MAMTLLALDPEAARRDIRILATDIDPAILARARAGRYDVDAMSGLPRELMQRWFDADAQGYWTVRPALAAIITFRDLNLAADWPVRGAVRRDLLPQRRNLFRPCRTGTLWTGFADRLAPGGVLCIGHSERLTGPAAPRLRAAGVTAYTLAG